MTTGPEIDGHTFLGRLGEGGYSDVYLYERRSPRMKVAVKVLKEGRLTPQEQRQFADEAETMAELADHPNIVQVFSADATHDGRPYLVMKYYPKPNLAARTAAERFSVAETLQTGVKIAAAVETAHRAGIIHRDIKPGNILVSQFDEPGLTDFGIAGHAADLDDTDDIGVSVPWSPPEVLSGDSNGSVRGDVYSLGATLWQLLCGRSPFEVPGGDNGAHALSRRVLHTPPPATGRGDVPASLERLLAQSLAKNPQVRPRSALELAQALQSIERELQLATTDIKVSGASGPERAVIERDPAERTGGGSTRLRPPARVEAQPRPPSGMPSRFAPGAAAQTSPATPEKRQSTRVRPPVVSAPDSPRVRRREPQPANPTTIRRPASDNPVDDPATTPPTRRGIRPRTAAVVAALVVVAAVSIGVAFFAGSGDTKNDATLPTTQATDQLDPPTSIPVPAVSSQYVAASKRLVFSWTVTGARPGDRYVWATTSDALDSTPPVTTTSTAIVTATPASTCIVVAYLPQGSSTRSDPVKACGHG